MPIEPLSLKEIKAFKPGSFITWLHLYPDGVEVERAGQVWDEAPQCRGLATFWVLPVESLDTDLYLLVPVSFQRRRARVGMQYTNKVRTVVDNEWIWKKVQIYGETVGRYVDKGVAFSEATPMSKHGKMSKFAAGHARAVKENKPWSTMQQVLASECV